MIRRGSLPTLKELYDLAQAIAIGAAAFACAALVSCSGQPL